MSVLNPFLAKGRKKNKKLFLVIKLMPKIVRHVNGIGYILIYYGLLTDNKWWCCDIRKIFEKEFFSSFQSTFLLQIFSENNSYFERYHQNSEMVLGTIEASVTFSDNICHSCMFQELSEIHDVLRNIFLIFPNYCLGRGLIDIAFNEYHNEYYFKTGE